MRECEDHLRESRKENFRLRMRIFFLEERLAGKSGTKQESDVGNLKREAETRLQLLVEATDALEAQEKRVEDERRAAALASEQHKCREAELQESLDQQERREEKLRERIQVLEEEKEELKRRGAKNEKKKEEEGGGRDEKGKECVEDTERMLLAVLRELEGIPSVNEDTRQQCTTPPTSSSSSSSSTVAILRRDLEAARCEVRSLRKEIEKRETRSRIQEEQLRAARMVNKLSGVLRSGRRGRRDQGSNTSSSTPLDTVQRLEEELVFKDQELVELRKELNVREIKIQQLQEVGEEKRGFALHGVKGGEGGKGRGVCGETSDAWSGPDTTVSLQRLGLPRHLLVPGSREESTTEMDDEEQEETEREEEEDEEDLELTFLCNPQVLQLKEEVEEGRRRLKECKALIQKLSVDNLRMTGRELSFRSQLEAAARRGANSSSFQETEATTRRGNPTTSEATTRRGNPTSEAAIRRGSSSTSAVKEEPGAGRT